MRPVTRVIALAGVFAVLAAACGGGGGTGEGGGSKIGLVDKIGPGEGKLNLVAWAGYVEDGTSPGGKAYDWVNPFEQKTGCQITVKYADSSD
ncbi:MAG: spermidine/putrescine ABC transporter substrate-binding protein, partial [Actinomycetota bacterium]